jgi:hypothetical protein
MARETQGCVRRFMLVCLLMFALGATVGQVGVPATAPAPDIATVGLAWPVTAPSCFKHGQRSFVKCIGTLVKPQVSSTCTLLPAAVHTGQQQAHRVLMSCSAVCTQAQNARMRWAAPFGGRRKSRSQGGRSSETASFVDEEVASNVSTTWAKVGDIPGRVSYRTARRVTALCTCPCNTRTCAYGR